LSTVNSKRKYRSRDTCIRTEGKLYTVLNMNRTYVEFENSVLCPFKTGDIKEIEKI